MKIHKGRQYIVTVNSEYIRYLYEQQTGEKKSHIEILHAVAEDINEFLEGNTKWIARFYLARRVAIVYHYATCTAQFARTTQGEAKKEIKFQYL